MLRIDLHTHSTASDGTLTPAELAKKAHRSGVRVIALTDHDTVAGTREFGNACARLGLRAITGIEMSAKAPYTTHILGYRMRDLSVMERGLNWVLEMRNKRNEEICEKLRSLGCNITMDEVRKKSGGGVVARPHFAELMIEKGFVASRNEAFDKYLARGKEAYAPRESYGAKECIALIKEAGGLASLAHPSLTGLEGEEFEELLSELKSFGLWGLECISSHCSSERSLEYLRAAQRHGLTATAGSDFHGSRRPGVRLGVAVSEDFLPWARLDAAL